MGGKGVLEVGIWCMKAQHEKPSLRSRQATTGMRTSLFAACVDGDKTASRERPQLLQESWVERPESRGQARPQQGILPKPHRIGRLL